MFFYIKRSEINKNMENGDKNEREKLVVVVNQLVIQQETFRTYL
jgi:hypothetical protein